MNALAASGSSVRSLPSPGTRRRIEFAPPLFQPIHFPTIRLPFSKVSKQQQLNRCHPFGGGRREISCEDQAIGSA